MKKLVLYNALLIVGFLLASCNRNLAPVKYNYQNYSVSYTLAEIDSQLVKVYTPYKEKLGKDMVRVISTSNRELVKGRPESLMTNFMADLLLEQGQKYCAENSTDFSLDISYVNYGGIRTYLPKGEITVGNIFELMPFENEMVFLKLKGTDVQTFYNKLATKGGDAISGAKFIISEDLAKNIRIGAEVLNPEEDYWLVTNDYIAEGGDGMDILLKRIEQVNTGRKIRDVIIEYMIDKQKRGEAIDSKLDGRISYE